VEGCACTKPAGYSQQRKFAVFDTVQAIASDEAPSIQQFNAI